MRRVLVLALLAGLADGRAAFTCLLEIAGSCDLAVHGVVTEVRERTVVLEIRRAWKAPKPPDIVVVDPFAARRCMEPLPRFAVGEEVILFLGPEKGGVRPISEAAEGKVPLPEGTRDDVVAAIDRLLEIAMLDEDGQDRAMLDLATSKDPILKREAHRRVSGMQGARYRAELLPLLDDKDAGARRAAAEALRRVRDPALVDRFIALTQDKDPGVVQSASVALATYDTDATVDAILALAGHESPHVRSRALIDLSTSRKPRARAALLSFLDDPDATVRKIAWDRLAARLREREDKEATARIGRLLAGGTSEDVRAEAAGIAFETGDRALVAPLLHALDGAAAGGALEANALRSLEWFAIFGGAEGKREVEARLDLVRRSVRRGTGGTAAVEILARAGDLATLREAARSHPDPLARDAAQRRLGPR